MADEPVQPERFNVLDYAAQMRRRVIPWRPILLTVLLLVIASSIFLVIAAPYRRESAKRAQCGRILSALGQVLLLYATDNQGRFPDGMETLVTAQDVPSSLLLCPSSNDTPAQGATPAAIVANIRAGGHLSYIYMGKGLSTGAPADTVLAYEPLSNHHGDGMWVLFGDSSVQWVDAKTAQPFVQLMATSPPVVRWKPGQPPTTAPAKATGRAAARPAQN
jgi:hypothetical protein